MSVQAGRHSGAVKSGVVGIESNGGSPVKRLPVESRKPVRHYFRYIIARGTALHFRISVPVNLRAVVGKAEVRHSLGAIHYTDARPKAYLLAARLRLLFKQIESGIAKGTPLSREKINELMHKILDWDLEQRESCLTELYAGKSSIYAATELIKHGKEYGDRIYSSVELDGSSHFDSVYCSMDDSMRSDMSARDDIVSSIAKHLPCDNSLAADIFDTFEREIRTNESNVGDDVFKVRGYFDRVSSVALKHTANKFDGSYRIDEAHGELSQYFPVADVVSSKHLDVAHANLSVSSSIKLSDAVERNIKVLDESDGEKNNKHGSKFKSHNLREMALVIGKDLPVDRITCDMVESYMKKLYHLPTNLVIKNLNYDINEYGVLRTASRKLAVKSIEKRLSDMRRFVNWLHENKHMDKGYAETICRKISAKIGDCELKVAQCGGTPTRAYYIEELKRLFDVDLYIKWSNSKGYYFWAPLIALFSGMRMGEILTLRRKDIKCTPDRLDIYIQAGSDRSMNCSDGIYYFDLSSTIEKDFKDRGGSSHRPVPMHTFLIGIGFIEYVNRFSSDDFIFIDGLRDNPNSKGYTDKFLNNYKLTDRFGEYRRSCGIGRMMGVTTGDQLTFHCFRNTCISKMKKSHVFPELRCEIAGHGDGEIKASTDHKGYGDKFTVEEKLRDGISNLDFNEQIPELALLAQSKWAKGVC